MFSPLGHCLVQATSIFVELQPPLPDLVTRVCAYMLSNYITALLVLQAWMGDRAYATHLNNMLYLCTSMQHLYE